MKKTLLSLALMLVALSPVSAQRVANGMQKVNVKELQKTLNKNDVSFLAVPEKVDGIIPTQEVATSRCCRYRYCAVFCYSSVFPQGLYIYL